MRSCPLALGHKNERQIRANDVGGLFRLFKELRKNSNTLKVKPDQETLEFAKKRNFEITANRTEHSKTG
jgi:hypothetical protein